MDGGRQSVSASSVGETMLNTPQGSISGLSVTIADEGFGGGGGDGGGGGGGDGGGGHQRNHRPAHRGGNTIHKDVDENGGENGDHDLDHNHNHAVVGGGSYDKARSSPIPEPSPFWAEPPSRGLGIEPLIATSSSISRKSITEPSGGGTTTTRDGNNSRGRSNAHSQPNGTPSPPLHPIDSNNPYGSARYSQPPTGSSAYGPFASLVHTNNHSYGTEKAAHSHALTGSTPTVAIGKPPLTDSTAYWLTWYFAFNLGLTLFNKLVLVSFPFAYVSGGAERGGGAIAERGRQRQRRRSDGAQQQARQD